MLTNLFFQIMCWKVISSNSVWCEGKNCISVYSPQNCFLPKNTVKELKLNTKGTYPSGFLVQVLYHMFDLPWKVVCDYINPDKENNLLTITIVSKQDYYLQAGETICHIKRFVPVAEVIQNLCGKFETFFY